MKNYFSHTDMVSKETQEFVANQAANGHEKELSEWGSAISADSYNMGVLFTAIGAGAAAVCMFAIDFVKNVVKDHKSKKEEEN